MPEPKDDLTDAGNPERVEAQTPTGPPPGKDLHHRPPIGPTPAEKQLPRILWYSNAIFVPTGYGGQSQLVTTRLNRLGFPIAVQCNVGVEGAILDVAGIPHYPRDPNLDNDRFSIKRIGPSAAHFGADLILTFLDVWALDARYFGDRALPVAMFPVDAQPMPRPVIAGASTFWDRITYSRFGWDMANAAGLDTHYIPHGIPTDVYCPGDRMAARRNERIGLDAGGEVDPELFVIGCVAANNDRRPSRKGWENIFAGVSLFRKRHPAGRRMKLFIHSRIDGAINLHVEADSCGIADITEVVNQNRIELGLSGTQMADMYRAFDVLVSVGNEGFGLPILEAQAVGTPVIVGDWTACSELAFSGIRIPKERAWKFGTHIDPAAFWYLASPEAICEALCAVADARTGTEWKTWQEDARAGAEAYDIDGIVRDFWVPTLCSMWERAQEERKEVTRPRPARDNPKRYTEDESDNVAQGISELEIAPDAFIVSPSEGEKCGIAEYARSCAYELATAKKYGYLIERVDSAVAIAADLESNLPVVVHHEYAFFDRRSPTLGRGETTPEVLERLYQYHLSGGKVALILHTVSPRGMEIAPNQLIKQYSEKGLPIYATSYDGAVYAGVRHCPLGAWSVPGFTPTDRLPDPDCPLVIGNFGFAQGHKDYGSHIELCKATGSVWFGQFACDRLSHAQQLRTVLAESGLPHAPILYTDFAENADLMERLSQADVFYMPRPPNDLFYSSASVITAMNAHRPVIINREGCYRDLWDTLEVADTVEEAAAIVERLRDPAEYRKAVERVKDYLTRRNVAKVWKEYGVI